MNTRPGNAQLERLIGLVAIGVTDALRENRLTVDEAAHLLFSPGTMKLLSGCKVNSALIEMVHSGTEIDDVARLVPAELENLLDRIRSAALAVLEGAPEYDFQEDKWLQLLLGEEVG